MNINEFTPKIKQLTALSKAAHNPKILWEEMQIVSQKAFDLQEELMALLDAAEKTETDIETVQTIFDTREMIWDVVGKIALREKEVKEKTHTKQPVKKAGAKGKKCCCGHDHAALDCQEHEHSHCCCGRKGCK